MLASLVDIYSFGSWYIYMDDIAGMICHIFQYYFQHEHDQNFRHLCSHYCVSTSDYIYLSVQVK